MAEKWRKIQPFLGLYSFHPIRYFEETLIQTNKKSSPTSTLSGIFLSVSCCNVETSIQKGNYSRRFRALQLDKKVQKRGHCTVYVRVRCNSCETSSETRKGWTTPAVTTCTWTLVPTTWADPQEIQKRMSLCKNIVYRIALIFCVIIEYTLLIKFHVNKRPIFWKL